MIPLNPAQQVNNLKGDLGGGFESSYLSFVADSTVWEKQRITCPAFAAAAQADYIHFTMPDGVTVAIWLDKDNDNTNPTGAVYVAAVEKNQAEIATGNTATQVAAAVVAALAILGPENDGIAGLVVTDNLNGTIDLQFRQAGDITIGRKSADDLGNGSFAFAQVTDFVASNYQNKYATLRNAADSAFYAWLNVDALGSDPAPAGTGIEVAISSQATAAQVATAVAAAIDANSHFVASADGSRVQCTNAAVGDATDMTVGNSPASLGAIAQGGSQRFYPALATADISNNPSAF